MRVLLRHDCGAMTMLQRAGRQEALNGAGKGWEDDGCDGTRCVNLHSYQMDTTQAVAAAKFWNLLIAPIERVSPFGQRLLFHLPRSPMGAWKWGLVGGPVDLDELRSALFDSSPLLNSERRLHARDVLYSYLSDYAAATASLGPPSHENSGHLIELAHLLCEIRSSSTVADDPRKVIPKMASMLADLLDADGGPGSIVEDLRSER